MRTCIVILIDGCDGRLIDGDVFPYAIEQLVDFIFIALTLCLKHVIDQCAGKGTQTGLGIGDMRSGKQAEDGLCDLVSIVGTKRDVFFRKRAYTKHQCVFMHSRFPGGLQDIFRQMLSIRICRNDDAVAAVLLYIAETGL